MKLPFQPKFMAIQESSAIIKNQNILTHHKLNIIINIEHCRVPSCINTIYCMQIPYWYYTNLWNISREINKKHVESCNKNNKIMPYNSDISKTLNKTKYPHLPI